MAQPFTVPNIPVYRGDSLDFPLYQIKSGEVGAETPVDLSAYTFTAQWRIHADAADKIDLIVDATAANTGTFDISATPTMTAQMTQSGVWDLQGTLSGEVETFIRGTTSWQADVTHA